MVIGIDIDDTITNHCEVWFDIYNKQYKKEGEKSIVLADAYKWNFYDDFPKPTRDALFEALENVDIYAKTLILLPNVKKTINEIISSGNKVMLISATFKNMQDFKKKWILEQLPILNEDDIIFTTKKELFNVDIMIDDNLNYASKFSCPFILFKQPWNTGKEQELYTDNVIMCSNWYEIEKYLFSKGIIKADAVSKETIFSDATLKLIEGIKNAKSNQECLDILNPYIERWQKQGILIGIAEMSGFMSKLSEEVDKDLKA